MKKFINHVDHAVYLSRWDAIEVNAAQLTALTDAEMERCERPDMGCVIYVDWAAGLEIVAPLPQRSQLNQALYDRLDSHGEGLLAIVFGVEDLEAHKAKLEAKGLQVGPLMVGHSDEPWFERLLLRERFGPQFMNSWLVFGQIDYADDEIKFIEVESKATIG